MRINRLVYWCTLLPLLLGGCIFSPKKSDKPIIGGPPMYEKMDQPGKVLDNLRLSYAARDSVEYKLLFDPVDYLGESTDQTASTVVTDTLYWDDEARHISALARATDVTRVEVEFGGNYQRLESGYVDDPPGSAIINITNPVVTIYYNNGSDAYQVHGVHLFEFRFGPDVAAPGDTTWQIIHWTEVRETL